MLTVCYVPHAVLSIGIGRKAPALTEFRRQRGRISRDEHATHRQVEMGAKKSTAVQAEWGGTVIQGAQESLRHFT